jgi:hypothetical protein
MRTVGFTGDALDAIGAEIGTRARGAAGDASTAGALRNITALNRVAR